MTLIKRLKNLWAWSILSPGEFLALYKYVPPKQPQPTLVHPVKEMPLQRNGVAVHGPKEYPKPKPKMAEIIKKNPKDPIDELLEGNHATNAII